MGKPFPGGRAVSSCPYSDFDVFLSSWLPGYISIQAAMFTHVPPQIQFFLTGTQRYSLPSPRNKSLRDGWWTCGFYPPKGLLPPFSLKMRSKLLVKVCLLGQNTTRRSKEMLYYKMRSNLRGEHSLTATLLFSDLPIQCQMQFPQGSKLKISTSAS